MPFFLAGLVVGAVGGFFVVKGTEAAGNLLMWGVLAGALYVAGKVAKVI